MALSARLLALQAFEQCLLAFLVSAGDLLDGLVEFDVVGYALQEVVVNDFLRVLGRVGFGLGFGRAAVDNVEAKFEVHGHDDV